MRITRTLLTASASFLSSAMLLMAQSPDAAVRAAVDAGNQAWIDGMKAGDIKRIVATYAEDAVDCGPTGECVRGKLQIERHMMTQLASQGRARSATVESRGATVQATFVYEWGRAEATFGSGKKVAENYLTAWQKQPDGTWKIFRNMVIPEK